MTREAHRLSGGVHTNAGGNWNRVWREWIGENPGASREQIPHQMGKMKTDFNLR